MSSAQSRILFGRHNRHAIGDVEGVPTRHFLPQHQSVDELSLFPARRQQRPGACHPSFQAIGCAKDLEGFAALYAQVRQSKVEAWADDLVAISEDRDSEPNDRRVRIDTKRWLMSKLVPKKIRRQNRTCRRPGCAYPAHCGWVGTRALIGSGTGCVGAVYRRAAGCNRSGVGYQRLRRAEVILQCATHWRY